MRPNMRPMEKTDLKGALRSLTVYLQKSLGVILLALVLAALSAVLPLIGPDQVGKIATLMSEGLVGGIDLAAVARVGVLLAVIYGLSALFGFIQHYIMASVTLKMSYRIRAELSEKINRVPQKYFNFHAQGDILSRITNDVSTLQQGLTNSLPTIISAATQFLGCLIMMFVTEWRLALVSLGITLVGLLRKMGKTPLQFLRHEAAGKSGTKRGVRLPERLSFVARFRLRIFLRNLGNFATLFVGIAFASLLLLFGLAILPTMTHYADNLETSLVAEHTYTLKAPLELEGTPEEREAWAAFERLQSINGTLLSAAEDAQDELEDAADAAQDAYNAAMASPSAETAQAATNALSKAQRKKDAFYACIDDIADALGCNRDDAIDLMEKAADIDTDDDDIHPINTTDNGSDAIDQAEKYAVYQLQYDRGNNNGTETVAVYGVQPDSRYWKDLNIGDGKVVFGAGLANKFGWNENQQVNLYDKYEDKTHSLTFSGQEDTWGSKSDMNVYMSIDDFNAMFDHDKSYFNGYVSNEALSLDSRYYASDTTHDDMRAVGEQFVDMMDSMIDTMVGLAVFIFLLFMYLLTKAVIDRSARSISYMKVFGYRDKEVTHLYIRSVTLCVVASLVLCQPLIIGSLTAIFRSMLLAYNGNIEIYVPWWCMAACVGIGFATYLLVAFMHTRSIKRVSLSEALKVQE